MNKKYVVGDKPIMLEQLFYILGIANNLFLILIFLTRNNMAVLSRIGIFYFLLAIPAFYCIFLVKKQHKSVRYSIFLGIFLAFLVIEILFDYVLRINFRETWNWNLLVPYLTLYYSMNYGFVVMSWKYYSKKSGIIMLGLFIIQIIANVSTHQ